MLSFNALETSNSNDTVVRCFHGYRMFNGRCPVGCPSATPPVIRTNDLKVHRDFTVN